MMEWTTEKPTVPGWYWWKNKQGGPMMSEVLDMDGSMTARFAVSGTFTVALLDGEWAGPIPTPGGERHA